MEKNVAQITPCHYTFLDIIRNKRQVQESKELTARFYIDNYFSGSRKPPQNPSDLEDYISEIYPDGGGKLWNCSICNSLSHRSKINVRNHIESVHFPGLFTYQCPHCGKELSSNNSLSQHVSRFHKK